MRIISGKFKGRRFDKKLPTGIRPTTDSTKETVFNILENLFDFDGKTVCDIFAGSGNLGFEALSRGVAFCTFVDRSRKAIEYIQTIAEQLKLDKKHYKCIKFDAYKYLKKMCEEETQLDLFFIDPPYELRLGNKIINTIKENNLLSDNGLIVNESMINDGLLLPDNFDIVAQKIFGTTQIHIIKKSN